MCELGGHVRTFPHSLSLSSGNQLKLSIAPCWTGTQTVFLPNSRDLIRHWWVLLYSRHLFIQRGLYEAVLLPSSPFCDYPPLISHVSVLQDQFLEQDCFLFASFSCFPLETEALDDGLFVKISFLHPIDPSLTILA